MKKIVRCFAQLWLTFVVLTAAMLGFPRTAEAADPPVPLSSLAPGTVVNFVGYNWIVLNPSTGYLLMQDNYSSQPFDCPSDPHDIYGDNVFDPNLQYNIGYYLNNLSPSQFSGSGFYQRIWYSYPDYKSLIIDHTFDIVGVDFYGVDQALVSKATTHVGLLSCSEWRNYSKYYNPTSGFLDNPSAPFWTINPNYGTCFNDLYVDISGHISFYIDNSPKGVRPTLYLNPNALIIGGKVTYYLAGSSPIVTGISTTWGPLSGGTQLTLTGYNFTGATGVSFGSVAAESFTVNSDNLITATAPAQAAGTVHVTLTSANGTSSTYPTDQFTYAPLPVVTGLSPANGFVSGDSVVAITGSGFTCATSVNFGGVAASSFTVNSDTSITATAPAESDGTVDVTVITPGGTSLTNPNDQFNYGQTPVVTGISPVVGSVSGGATATITGCRFIGATAVNFGSVAASFTVQNDNTITAIVPAQAAGVVDVTVINHGQRSPTVSADQLTYSTNDLVGWWKLDEGSGTTAHDSSGYGDNGTATQLGSSFDPAWDSDHPALIDQVGGSLDFSGGNGNSQFTAPVPTSATNNVSISAWVKWYGTHPSSDALIAMNGDNPNGYGLLLDTSGKPEIFCNNWVYTTTALTPNTWQNVAAVEDGSGNWKIYLNGIQVGQGSGNPLPPGGQMVIGYSPGFPQFPGLIADVRIYTAALTQAQVQQLAAVNPAVTGVSPAGGPAAGGTTVTITGKGLTWATGVSFGGTPAASFTVNSDSSITATAPAHAAGTVSVIVAVQTGMGGSGTAAGSFTYGAAPAVAAIDPATGPEAGGTPVIITGTGFTGATSVSFGGVAASGFTVNSDTSITAISPAGSAGTVDVNVTTPGGTSATGAADQFAYSANELVGWWKLGDGSGTTAADSSGYGDNGTLTNPVWSSDHPTLIDQVGTSLDFSGGISSFTAPVPTVATGNVSISAWVKWNGTTGVSNYQPIVYNGNPGADGYGLFLDGSGNLEVLCGGIAWLNTTVKLIPNTWQQVAVVGVAGSGTENWTVYLNGSPASPVSAGSIAPAPGDKMLIGYAANATSTPTHFPGLIGDVRVYATALTTAQVQQLATTLPIVTGISPSGGPVSGGTAVTISGSGFTGVTGVSFGRVAATGFTVNSDTSITATSPAGSGTVDVKVTTPIGISTTVSGDQFTYAAPVTLSSIAITSPATKLSYTVGDTLNLSGLVVTGTYSDNSTTPEAITAANVTGFNSSVPAARQTLTITVNGKTTTYTVAINVAPASTDATLAGLSLSSGTLSPVFATGTTSYTASVSNNVTSITVTPIVNERQATITVNGNAVTSGSASGVVNLNVGDNTITTVVTAQDGTTTKTYTVTVTRAADNGGSAGGGGGGWSWNPGQLQFSQSTYSVDENAGTATVTVNRLYGSDGTVTVHFSTSDNTATSGEDYTATSGDLTFGYGETSKTFTIRITNDNVLEDNETVNLTLTNPIGGAYLGSQATATLTILDTTLPDDQQYLLFPVSGIANGVSTDKTWQIVFNQEVDPKTVDQASVFICNAKTGERQQVSYEFANDPSNKATTLTIKPTQPYVSGQNYILYITTGVKTVNGSVLKQGLRVPFSVQHAPPIPIW